MEMKITNKSHRYDINRPRSRYGRKCSKYKECFSDAYMYQTTPWWQHLSNTWGSIHEKVKQHWGWVEKKRYL